MRGGGGGAPLDPTPWDPGACPRPQSFPPHILWDQFWCILRKMGEEVGQFYSTCDVHTRNTSSHLGRGFLHLSHIFLFLRVFCLWSVGNSEVLSRVHVQSATTSIKLLNKFLAWEYATVLFSPPPFFLCNMLQATKLHRVCLALGEPFCWKEIWAACCSGLLPPAWLAALQVILMVYRSFSLYRSSSHFHGHVLSVTPPSPGQPLTLFYCAIWVVVYC